MLTPADALDLILQNQAVFPAETCALAQAHGRVLRADIRADRDLPPRHRARNHVEEFRGRIALHIQLRHPLGTQSLQDFHIAVARMALILSRMQRDAVRAQFQTAGGKRLHIRIVSAAGVSQQGDLVNVNRKLGHTGAISLSDADFQLYRCS